MVNRLVAVDEDGNLPEGVKTQLIAPLEAEFSDLATEAVDAASAASAASIEAIDAKNLAVAAATSAGQETDDQVASLIQDTAPSATRSALISTIGSIAFSSTTGFYSARPAASSVSPGSWYYATDVLETYRSDGSTWTPVNSGGNELGYAARTSNQVIATGANLLVDVTGVTFSFVMPERPVRLQVGIIASYPFTTSDAVVQVLDVTASNAVLLEVHSGQSNNSSDYQEAFGAVRLTGAAGTTKTYKLAALRRIAGDWTLAGSTTFPIWMGVYTC